jgi:hypothetical protein
MDDDRGARGMLIERCAMKVVISITLQVYTWPGVGQMSGVAARSYAMEGQYMCPMVPWWVLRLFVAVYEVAKSQRGGNDA